MKVYHKESFRRLNMLATVVFFTLYTAITTSKFGTKSIRNVAHFHAVYVAYEALRVIFIILSDSVFQEDKTVSPFEVNTVDRYWFEVGVRRVDGSFEKLHNIPRSV